jgi:geranylgeranyl reductase family protein
MMRDVVVVGAGPAGIHAASRLAEAGLSVALVEGQARIGERAICSGVIGEEGFTQFDLPSETIQTSIHCIQAISPQGRVLEHGGDGPLARVINKREFNRALGKRALAAGVDIHLGRWVDSLEVEKHSVSVRFRSPQGGEAALKARLAVITTGVNCALNQALGLVRPRQFLRALQVEISLPNHDASLATRVYVGRSIAPGAFGWEIPLGYGRVRVGLMTHQDPEPFFVNLLRRVAPSVEVSSLHVMRKGIAQAPLGRCVRERVMAAGEAAGHVKTTTGGGIYYGMLSAELAAEVIVRAFRKGDFSSGQLADFERYWRSAFGHELLVGYFARKLASQFSDAQIEALFQAVQASDLLRRLNGRLKFDWHQKALLTTIRSLLSVHGGNGTH